MRSYNLEERLIRFSVSIYNYLKSVPRNLLTETLSKQLIRSGTSVSLNYGVSIFSESNKDFIHKLSLVLKELKETEICLRILILSLEKDPNLETILQENIELLKIFNKSRHTARLKNSN